METRESQLEAMEMLQKHESALGHLYEVYGNKLPRHEAFWDDLVVQERSHAFMIQTLRAMIEGGSLVYEYRPFKKEEIKASMQKLSRFMDYALRNDIDMKEALETAMSMEKGMIEDGLFTPRPGDPEELVKVLEALSEDTTRHFQSIKGMWGKLYRDDAPA